MIRKIVKFLPLFIGVILLLGIAIVGPIDRTPIRESDHYRAWESWIEGHSFSPATGPVRVGWAIENLTPDHPVPMAGYGDRWGKHFEEVRDSLQVRALTVSGAGRTITFVGADLLIVPPNVTERLSDSLESEGISLRDIHMGATHTHHGIGGWGKKLAGRLFAGKFDPQVEELLAEKLLNAILASRSHTVPADVQSLDVPYERGIRNRLDVSDPLVDSVVRGLLFSRADGKRGILLTYGAHSTVLAGDSLYLSRDYPGRVLDELQARGLDFSVFMAGAVGGMSYKADGETREDRLEHLAVGIADTVLSSSWAESAPVHILSEWIHVPLPPQTARISKNYALRPWVFSALFGQSPGDVKLTLIGRTLLLGMPADFSGEIMTELDAYAAEKGLQLILTSFNGHYVGYISHDKNYELPLYETTTMSWNGFGAGDYYTRVAKDLIDKTAAAIPTILNN